MTHQRDAKTLDAMINVHACGHVVSAHIGGCSYDVRVAEVPVSPGVLTDEILGRSVSGDGFCGDGWGMVGVLGNGVGGKLRSARGSHPFRLQLV
jgi:hypothetical protein